MSVPSPLRTLENKDGCIFGVVISRDGKQIVTAGGTLEKPSELGSPWKETALRVWNAATGEQTRVLKHASLHDGISGVALSVDGRTFAVASEKQLYFWDIKEGKFLRTLPAPGGGRETIGAFQFSPDGKRLAAGVGNAICLWDTASGRLLSPEGEEPIADLASVAVSGDGLLLAAGRKDGRIELWHLPTQRLLRHWAGHSEAVGGLAFAPNLKTLASRSRTGVIRLWDLTSGRRQREIKQGKKEGAGTAWLSYTRDGNRLACDYQSEGIIGIRFWDPVRGREMENIKTTVDPQEWLFAVTLSKDDRHLQALTTFGNLQHWRREDGRFGKPTVRPIQLSDPLFSPFSWSIAFAKDGTLATVDSSRRRIEIWGPSRRIGIGSGEVPTDPLRDLAFSPSDSYLVLLSQAGVHDLRALLNVVPEAYTLRMYEIASRREVLFRALPLAVGIRCYAFTPDGRRLITGMADTTILVWDLFACDSAKVDDLPALWADMKQEDGRRAHRALSALIAAGDKAVAFLDRPLQSIEGPKAEQLVRWVGDLDSDQFAVREQAEKRLAMAGELARGALERALASRPALEQRRRIDALLAELDDAVPDGETLRRLRAIVVLEYIGTPAARRLLRRLCDGAREARLSHEAKMALQRMTGGATRE